MRKRKGSYARIEGLRKGKEKHKLINDLTDKIRDNLLSELIETALSEITKKNRILSFHRIRRNTFLPVFGPQSPGYRCNLYKLWSAPT